jgi:AcrR family transcriptional regulator
LRQLVTRIDYFAVALTVLADEGHGALKIGTLCRSLGVTAGSFYNYFGSFDGFVDELLGYWEQEKTQRIFAAASAVPDPVGRVRLVKSLAVELPHGAETAIRAWAHVNPSVAEAQRRVDQERRTALREVLAGVIPIEREADELAIIGISLLVGIQQWRSPVDPAELGRVLDEFEILVMDRARALALH